MHPCSPRPNVLLWESSCCKSGAILGPSAPGRCKLWNILVPRKRNVVEKHVVRDLYPLVLMMWAVMPQLDD